MGKINGLIFKLTAHDGLAPEVQGALFMLPLTHWATVFANLNFRGNFCQIAIGISHHEKNIIAWPVTSNTPNNLNPQFAHVIGPIFQFKPTGRFKRLVIKAADRRTKKGQRVVHFIAADKAGFEMTLVVFHHIRQSETKGLRVKAFHVFHLLCAKCEML
jgi:hypothetical protein